MIWRNNGARYTISLQYRTLILQGGGEASLQVPRRDGSIAPRRANGGLVMGFVFEGCPWRKLCCCSHIRRTGGGGGSFWKVIFSSLPRQTVSQGDEQPNETSGAQCTFMIRSLDFGAMCGNIQSIGKWQKVHMMGERWQEVGIRFVTFLRDRSLFVCAGRPRPAMALECRSPLSADAVRCVLV